MNNSVPTTPTKVLAWCKELQNMEGWYAPGTTVEGVSYPTGSPSFSHNNPGNLRCNPQNKAAWNVLAVGQRGGFCVFPSATVGFQALVNVTLAQCKGISPTYNAEARKLGLNNSGELNFYQYFNIRDPKSDGNDPVALAVRFGKALNCDPTTTRMKDLLV